MACNNTSTFNDECYNSSSPPSVSDDEIEKNLPIMLEKVGLESCTLQDGSVFSIFNGGIQQYSSSIGCETIKSITRKYLEMQKVIACSLTEISNCSNDTVTVNQNVWIENLPTGTIECTCPPGATCTSQGLVITQDANVKRLQTTQVLTITNNISSKMQEFVKSIFLELKKIRHDNKNSYLNTINAEKQLDEIVESIDTIVETTEWYNIVNEVISDFFSSQNITIKNAGWISGSQCIMSQNLIATLVSDTIITTGLQSIFEDNNIKTFFQDIEDYDEKNNIIVQQPLKIWVVLLIVFGSLGSIAAIIAAIVGAFLKSKKK